jgi:hypothetical protein
MQLGRMDRFGGRHQCHHLSLNTGRA